MATSVGDPAKSVLNDAQRTWVEKMGSALAARQTSARDEAIVAQRSVARQSDSGRSEIQHADGANKPGGPNDQPQPCLTRAWALYKYSGFMFTTGEFGTTCPPDGTIAIPHNSQGTLSFVADFRWGAGWGESFATEWSVDARGEGLKFHGTTTAKTDTVAGPSFPGLDDDEWNWEVHSDADSITIQLKATYNDRPLNEPNRETHSFKLSLDKTFPDAKVEIGDEVTVTIERTVEIGPFEKGKAQLLSKHVNDLKAFWDSLSQDTRNAITENQLPGGSPITIDGYASNTDNVADNFALADARALAVMRAIQSMSGNRRTDPAIFRPKSHSEWESPFATDRRSDERELNQYRKAVVTLLDVFIPKKYGP